MIDDNYILENFFINGKAVTHKSKFAKHPGAEEYLLNRFNDDKNLTIAQIIRRIAFKIEHRTYCKICGKETKFHRNKYLEHCSYLCAQRDKETSKKIKQTKLDKYGDENYNNQDKHKVTCIEKYGKPSFSQTDEFIEKIKATNKERYGVEFAMQSKELRERFEKSCLKNNDTKYFPQSEKFKELYKNKEYVEKVNQHRIETNLVRYGKENYSQTDEYRERCLNDEALRKRLEKSKRTNNERYGVDFWVQSEEGKIKFLESYDKRLEATKRTNNERYGVDFYVQTDALKDAVRNMFNDKEKIKARSEKCFKTQKENGTLGKSKQELDILDIIKSEYPDVIHHYKDKDRYPFNCDFYIPSLDLFIEYNGYWTHGPHSFNENDIEDLKLLEKWKNENEIKGTRSGGIDTWTRRDPLKAKTAKDNNLNYLILWTADYKNNLILEKINKYKK